MNCIVCAVLQKIRHPLRVKLKCKRNAGGRWHVYWTKDGVAYEWYAKGRSKKTYLQNCFYLGQVKRVK